MSRDNIQITVRWPSGARWTKLPFWMTDEQIIRDTCQALGVLAPAPEECTVERGGRDDE